MIIEKQSKADQPGRSAPAHPGHDKAQNFRCRRVTLKPHILVVRQYKAHWPTDMGHRAQQRFALFKSFPHEADFEKFEIAQPTMEKLGRGRRCRRCQVIHFRQRHRQPTTRGIPGNTAAVNAPTDDEEIDF